VFRRSLLVAALPLAGCASPALRIDDSRRARAQDSRVLFVVLHYTDGDFQRSLRTLTEGEVSAHYLVSDESPPRILRLVDEERRAWHAGLSSWQQHAGLNASSIGIEIVNPGLVEQADGSQAFAPYPPAQIDAVVALVQDIVRRHAVRPEHVLGHSDIAPQRRIDPGPAFPWQRLAAAGLVRWPDPARAAAARAAFALHPPDVAWFQPALAQLGYRVPQHGRLDEETRRVVAAFQMKYRPARHDGEPDAESAALLQALL
jgi:N-acetylmuramoyl-L-alanine amidase